MSRTDFRSRRRQNLLPMMMRISRTWPGWCIHANNWYKSRTCIALHKGPLSLSFFGFTFWQHATALVSSTSSFSLWQKKCQKVDNRGIMCPSYFVFFFFIDSFWWPPRPCPDWRSSIKPLEFSSSCKRRRYATFLLHLERGMVYPSQSTVLLQKLTGARLHRSSKGSMNVVDQLWSPSHTRSTNFLAQFVLL